MLTQTRERATSASVNDKMEQSHLSTFSNIEQLTLSIKLELDKISSNVDTDEINEVLSKKIAHLDYALIQELYKKLENFQTHSKLNDKVIEVKIYNLIDLLIRNIRYYLRQAMDLGHMTKNQDFYLFGIYD